MKKMIILAILLAGGMALSGSFNIHSAAAAEPPLHTGFGLFYTNLSPHGEWMDFPDGTQVWRPLNLPRGWRPYTLGRWEWTDEGWYWISDEPFGWIVYHYGRWFYDDFYRWVWIPDDVWAPSWVEWRSSGECIGWAPLVPYALFDFSVGLHYSHGWRSPEHYWSFVPYERFSRNFHAGDFMGRKDVHRAFGATRSAGGFDILHNRVINRGVSPDDISRHGNIRIEQRSINERKIPGEQMTQSRGSRIEVYRPALSEARQPIVLPNFRHGERPLSGNFQNVSGSRSSSEKNGRSVSAEQNKISRERRNSGHQKSAVHQGRAAEKRTQGQKKEMRHQLIDRYNRDRNTGPELRTSEKRGR
jgi:hypothetical protein